MTLWTVFLQALLSKGFPRQEYWSGLLFPSPGDLSNPGIEPGLPHCRQILYQLSHKGSPRILDWVAYPFSSRSSRPRNWTGVSCIADGFFTNWAIREAHKMASWEICLCLCCIKEKDLWMRKLCCFLMKMRKQLCCFRNTAFLLEKWLATCQMKA